MNFTKQIPKKKRGLEKRKQGNYMIQREPIKGKMIYERKDQWVFNKNWSNNKDKGQTKVKDQNN